MKMELLDSTKLKISLTKADLETLKITYDEIDYDNPYAKLILTRLLLKAKTKTGFSPENSRLFIEIYPEEDEGCTLYFTALDQLEEPEKPVQNVPVVFEFAGLDELAEASCKLLCQSGHPSCKSSMYHLRESYYLILFPTQEISSKALALLSEYGHKSGEGVVYASFIAEHGTALIEEDAIDKISLYLS